MAKIAAMSGGAVRAGGKVNFDGKAALFKGFAWFSALFFFVYKGIYSFYDAAHMQTYDIQYLTVLSALLALAISFCIAKQIREPEKNINLMQIGAMGMAAPLSWALSTAPTAWAAAGCFSRSSFRLA